MSDVPEAMTNLARPSENDVPNVNPEGNEALDAAAIAAHYEQDDVDVLALARWGGTIAIAAVIFGVILWLLIRTWSGQPVRPTPQVAPADVTVPQVSGPGLDAVPEVRLAEQMQIEDARLHTYGWIDRANGIVHIPIDDAMRLLVERGVPAREGAVPAFGVDPSHQLDSSGGTRSFDHVASEEADND